MQSLFRTSIFRALPGVAVIALLGGPRLMEAHAAAMRRAENARARAQQHDDAAPKRTASQSGKTNSHGRSNDSRDSQDAPSVSAGFAATCVCKPDGGDRAPIGLTAVGGQRVVCSQQTPDQILHWVGGRAAQHLHRAVFDAHAPPSIA